MMHIVLGTLWNTGFRLLPIILLMCLVALMSGKIGFAMGYAVGYTAGVESTLELKKALSELWKTAVTIIRSMSSQLGTFGMKISTEDQLLEKMNVETIRQTTQQLSRLNVSNAFKKVGSKVGSFLGIG